MELIDFLLSFIGPMEVEDRRPDMLNNIQLLTGPSFAESPVGNRVSLRCYLLSGFVICDWLSSWTTKVLIGRLYCESVSLTPCNMSLFVCPLHSAGSSGEVEGHALVSAGPKRPERHQPELTAHADRSRWSQPM